MGCVAVAYGYDEIFFDIEVLVEECGGFLYIRVTLGEFDLMFRGERGALRSCHKSAHGYHYEAHSAVSQIPKLPLTLHELISPTFSSVQSHLQALNLPCFL